MLETPSIQTYQPNGGDNGSDAGNQQERSALPKSSETSTLPLDRKYRVRDVAYMGGIIDGEGCISAHWNNGHPFVYVKVTNTDYRLPKWIQDHFGGRIQVKGGVRKDNWKQSWDWYCYAEDTIPFLKMMVPFLKLKQKQAYLAMAIRRAILRKKSRVRVERAIVKLKAMNSRGRYSPV